MALINHKSELLENAADWSHSHITVDSALTIRPKHGCFSYKPGKNRSPTLSAGSVPLLKMLPVNGAKQREIASPNTEF